MPAVEPAGCGPPCAPRRTRKGVRDLAELFRRRALREVVAPCAAALLDAARREARSTAGAVIAPA